MSICHKQNRTDNISVHKISANEEACTAFKTNLSVASLFALLQVCDAALEPLGEIAAEDEVTHSGLSVEGHAVSARPPLHPVKAFHSFLSRETKTPLIALKFKHIHTLIIITYIKG